MTFLKALISKNILIIHAGLLLFIAKLFTAILICTTSLILFSDLYLCGTWIMVSLLIDALIFSIKPRFLFDFTLTEYEQVRYRIFSNELKRYLQFTPMVRFVRTLLMTIFIIAFLPKTDLDTILISLAIGFLIVDPIVGKFLGIKAPTLFNKIPADESIVSVDIHRNNPAYIGSAAWNAFESTRPLKNNF